MPWQDHRITASGSPTPKTAAVICSALVKTIELSFITVFIAFFGQLFSIRAMAQREDITPAEMSMRSWVMQPVTMITHWEIIKYGAASWPGILALLAAIMSMFYTTVSSALVERKLKLREEKFHVFHGKVEISFANPA